MMSKNEVYGGGTVSRDGDFFHGLGCLGLAPDVLVSMGTGAQAATRSERMSLVRKGLS